MTVDASEYRLYNKFMKDIQKYPLLTREEELELLIRATKGDKRAIDRLVLSNQKFVIKVAFLYKGQGMSITDLIGEGNIGLVTAIKRFDIHKNVKFTSYAVWWIRQSILQAIFEKSRIVRISAQKELVLRRFGKHNPVLQAQTGGGYGIDAKDLAGKLGISEEETSKVIEMGQGHFSLDAEGGAERDLTLRDRLADTTVEHPDEFASQQSVEKMLTMHMDALTGIEKKVVQFHFGMESHQPMSLRKIGDLFGLSRERVRQIKDAALNKLRQNSAEYEYLLAA